MLKKLSMRWRMTLLSALLLTVCCIGLTFVLNLSVYKMVDGIDTMTPASPAIEPADIQKQHSESELVPAIPAEEISLMKKAFSVQSVLYMLIVILGGSALTYYVAGKALKPLSTLNMQIKNLTVQNLSQSLTVPPTNDEIAELTRSFNEMTGKLEKSFETQKCFSANAAHELRTPLAVLQTKVDVFKKSASHATAEYDALIAVFEKQVERLRGLVKTLLDMTNIDDDVEQDTIHLKDVLEDIVTELTTVAQKHKVTLKLRCDDCTIIGNLDLLYRVFYNLVENGIKYNKENGIVTVEANKLPNGKAEISVTDTGIGIPDEMKKQIFEPFFRVDKSRSRAMGGAGLGLAMTEKIIQKHHGSIIVEDNENGGSCFKIVL